MKQSKKQAKRAQARVADYVAMLAQPGTKTYEGYHKPGSNKK